MLATYYYHILLKSPGLTVFSGPRYVLRKSQSGLIMSKHGFLVRSMYNDGGFYILLCTALIYVQLKPHFFEADFLIPMFTIITPDPYTRSKRSKTFLARCN